MSRGRPGNDGYTSTPRLTHKLVRIDWSWRCPTNPGNSGSAAFGRIIGETPTFSAIRQPLGNELNGLGSMPRRPRREHLPAPPESRLVASHETEAVAHREMPLYVRNVRPGQDTPVAMAPVNQRRDRCREHDQRRLADVVVDDRVARVLGQRTGDDVRLSQPVASPAIRSRNAWLSR